MHHLQNLNSFFWKNDGFSDNVRWLPNGHDEKGALTLLLIQFDINLKIEITPLTYLQIILGCLKKTNPLQCEFHPIFHNPLPFYFKNP
jgi:hypothetical protein